MLKHEMVPGYNVDRINVKNGLQSAVNLGYSDWKSQMEIEYALNRWAKGEEELAQKSMLSAGIDLTSIYVILAHAMVEE